MKAKNVEEFKNAEFSNENHLENAETIHSFLQYLMALYE